MRVALIDLQTIIFRRSLGSNFLQRVLAYYVLYFCLAEGGEVTHYEVLSVMTKGVKGYKRFAQMQKHIEIDYGI